MTPVNSEPSEADLAAEWEQALTNGDAGAPADAEAGEIDQARVLNQDEIDSLLGFGDEHSEDGEASGIQAIVNSSLVSYERLPMLEVVFDRLVRLMSTSMRNFTSDNVEVSLDSIASVRFGDYLNGIPLPAMLSVIKTQEWDNYGLITIDSSLIYSIVDVLLGGRRGTAAMRIEGRPYTTIERSLVERMIRVVLADLNAAFEPLSPVDFCFERLETNPRFATISRPSNAAILARLRIDMEDRGGRLDLILPYATLEPVRELLLQMFMGEKFGRDSIWETHLAQELWSTDIELTAVMDEQTISLKDIFNLRVGSQIMFNVTPDSPIEMRCGGVSMYTAKMGRHGGRIAVQVDDRIPTGNEDVSPVSITLVLDVLLVILLAATLGFGLLLNKRLNDLRRDRGDLEKLATGFGDATRRAEESVATLKISAASLQDRLEKAQALADDLQYLTERATTVADRLRRMSARPGSTMAGAAPPLARPPARVTPFAPGEAALPTPRSQAERNLLQALRMKG